MSLLTLNGLSASRNGKPVLTGIDLTINKGEFVGLLGPNGAGKTTLLRAALGLLPYQGNSSLGALSPDDLARTAAFMPQGRDIAWPVPVEHLVGLGRTPYRDHRARHPAVERALNALELQSLRHRSATQLSGGEQARVLIARMLTQEAPLMIADEPIAGLDPAAQIKVMTTFAQLADKGQAVLASLHDLGLAARHCSRLILLSEGRIAADGPPTKVLTPDRIAKVFGITAFFASTAQGPVFQPLEILGDDATY